MPIEKENKVMSQGHPSPERKTDRVTLTIQIRIFGSDVAGMAFTEESCTLELSPHGALIVVKRQLAPQDEIVIRRERTGKEAEAKIVGQVASGPEGFVYGVSFLDPNVNLWEINFVPVDEAERAVGRTLLECAKCQLREVVYLEEFEVEVYKANEYIFRSCNRCRETTIWRESLHEPAERAPAFTQAAAAPPPPTPEAARTRNDRRHTRVKSKLKACLIFTQFDDEILEVSDVSRGGFGFLSRKQLFVGWTLRVAIPYSSGAGNIFVPAKIVRARPLPDQRMFEYGTAYLKD